MWFNPYCLVFPTFTGGWVAGWLGGWSEDRRVMLNSTQDQVEVEVRVELGNMKQICDKNVLE